MKKKERQQLIAKMITTNEIATQDDLVKQIEILTGKTVTQATISRDIKELALIKIPAETTNFKYSLPQNNDSEDWQRMKTLMSSSLVEIKTKEKIVVIRTTPGSALALKRLIRDQFSDSIFSILADDDSILIDLEEDVATESWVAELKR